jgi:glycerate 2-kinase
VADAIGRGLQAGDPDLEVDRCPLDESPAGLTELPADIDARLRRARTVVIATSCLDHETLLRRGAVFEIATRARQAGVPCCAVAGRDELDPFEARILDLQVVLEAADTRALVRAGSRLADLI